MSNNNEFLKLLNSLNKKPEKVKNEEIDEKKEEQQQKQQNKKKLYEFFDVNRLNNEFEKLMNDVDKEKSSSSHILEILKIIQNDISILSSIITMITNKVTELKLINSFDTSLTTLSLSQKLVCNRIVEGCNNIILFNNEKDKNLEAFFNNYASKFIDFNELMHQKGIKILLIDNQNITLPDKKKALAILNQIDTKTDLKDPHPNSNDKAFAFIETNKNTVNILYENTSLIIGE